MQHNVTGLKYFCKTTCLDRVNSYKGSGVYWRNHINKHGKDITVGVLGFYLDKDRCLAAANKFSMDNNIVDDDAWANLVEETGMNGASLKGEKNPFYGKKHTKESIELARQKKLGISVNKGAIRSLEHRKKLSLALKGKPRPDISKILTGRKLTEETKVKISASNKGRKFSKESIEKLRNAAIEQWKRQKAKLTILDEQP